MAAGMRPISNVVDITNYVMLLTGQPLHAFDLDRVAGQRLVVRAAREGETIDTLDGQTRTLEEGEIVIDDADGPTSLAGVMGGARSEVADDTTRVLMEVASWHAPTIQRTSQPPRRCARRRAAASRRACRPGRRWRPRRSPTQLMVELCGARIVDGTIDVRAPAEPAAELVLRPARVERLLGKPIARERQAEILDDARLRRHRRRRRAARRRPALPRARRHPRGRPRRGGRAHRRPRQPARHAALAPRRVRPPDARPARPPPRRGRARRPRPVRGRRLVVHASVGRRQAPPARRRPAPALRADRQPDVRGPVAPAHDAARVAARRRPRTTSRAARPTSRSSRAARSTSTSSPPTTPRRSRPTATRSRRRCAPIPGLPLERHALGGAARRPRRRRLLARRRAPRRGTSSPPRASSARCSTRCASTGTSGPASRTRSCTRAARRACTRARWSSAGSARCTRSSRASGTSRGRPPRSSSTSSSPSSRRPTRSTTAT